MSGNTASLNTTTALCSTDSSSNVEQHKPKRATKSLRKTTVGYEVTQKSADVMFRTFSFEDELDEIRLLFHPMIH